MNLISNARLTTAVIAASFVIGCAPANDSRPIEGPLASLAVHPSLLPKSCGLFWKTRPIPLAMLPKEEQDFFIMMAQFWVGQEFHLGPDNLDVGLSNVYSLPSSDNAVVIAFFRFKDSSGAAKAVEVRRKQQEGNPQQWWHQEGRLAIFSANEPGVPLECVEFIRNESVKRAKGSA